MKKILGMLLIVATVLLCFASCNDGQVDDSPNINDGGGNTLDPDDGNGNGGEKPVDPTPDKDPTPVPDPSVYTVYLLNRAEWEEVAVYYWNSSGDIEGGWPGMELLQGRDGLYKAVIDKSYTKVIFNNNNNGDQTADLNIPTDDKVVYDNLDKLWLTYSEAIEILNGTDNPGSGTDNPGSGTDNPGGGTDNPGSGTDNPGSGTDNPGSGTDNPGSGTDNPGGGTDNPGSGTDNPGSGTDNPGSGTDNPGSGTDNPGSGQEMTDELKLFYDFFDPQNHISFKLDISKAELKKIQKDYEKYSSFGSKSPIYRMADLYVSITTPEGITTEYVIEQVGVRMKGNTSRTNFYSDSDGMYNLVHFKISFQETFDEAEYYGSEALVWTDAALRKERKNRTFATLEKIDIRWNKNDDTTYIKESYAYDLYREFGVLAPHTNLASVDIGNDHAGVWVFYEPIDKIFLEKNLPAEAIGGDLYKLGWTSEGATFTSFSSYGVEDEDAGKFYVYDLKTNKKTSTHQSLKNVISVLNSTSLTKDKFASVVDVENFMYFCAVSYFVGSPDDLRNNYNNCYIYFRADTGKMIVIPYDIDRGFGVTKDWDPYGSAGTNVSPYQKTNVCGDQRNPLFKKTVCEGGMYVTEFTEALKAVDASEMLTDAAFKNRFDLAKSLYSSEAKTSKTYHNAGGHQLKFDIDCSGNGNWSFSNYMKELRETLYNHIGNQGNNNPDTDSGNDNENQNPEPIKDCDPFIRGDFNNWSNDGNYRMTDNGDGTYSITLTFNESFRFKVYNDRTGVWYGTEAISEDCTVDYESDKRTNINLSAGTYLVTFSKETSMITIEKQ